MIHLIVDHSYLYNFGTVIYTNFCILFFPRCICMYNTGMLLGYVQLWTIMVYAVVYWNVGSGVLLAL